MTVDLKEKCDDRSPQRRHYRDREQENVRQTVEIVACVLHRFKEAEESQAADVHCEKRSGEGDDMGNEPASAPTFQGNDHCRNRR